MKNKYTLLILTIIIGAFISLVPLQIIQASSKDDVCVGLSIAGGSCDAPAAGQPSVNNTIQTALNLLSVVVGVAAVIMIIVGGLQYITSSGESSKTATAKNTILYAVIGLAIVALAQVIVNFVIRKVA